MIAALVLAAATAAPFALHSGDFIAGGAMPAVLMATDCGGANHTPSLVWSGAPAGTKSFALIVHDPDAPIAGGFYHWILYDLPVSATQLRGDAAPPAGTRAGLASTGRAAYYGPCPPPGPAHHYVFTLYALDVPAIGAGTPLEAPALMQRIAKHVLAKATIEATAAHP